MSFVLSSQCRNTKKLFYNSPVFKLNLPIKRYIQRNCCVFSNGMDLEEVVRILESYASPSLAESWDNVGLLVEPSHPHHVRKLFLTNDLTEKVLDEADQRGANLILSYHPPIFSSIKRITQETWKNRILVKAIENRIAIYSPHTSYDVIKGGVNDWLISCFDGNVKPIKPNNDDSESGIGRICELARPLSVSKIIENVKDHLQLINLRVAYPNPRQEMISSIASCAGSGGSVLNDVEADLYLTGEMSHHEVLHAVGNKRTVLLCEHSNTERGFFDELKPKLHSLMDGKVEILISKTDQDPLIIV